MNAKEEIGERIAIRKPQRPQSRNSRRLHQREHYGVVSLANQQGTKRASKWQKLCVMFINSLNIHSRFVDTFYKLACIMPTEVDMAQRPVCEWRG